MADLIDIIHQEVSRALAGRTGIKAATITSYDENNHLIKAMIQPDGIETGWFPHSVAYIGNGYGVVTGPNIGDQITVGFFDGDLESPVQLGRVHSDKERPPVAKSGEIVIRDKNGSQTKFDSTGVTHTVGGTTLKIGVDGSVSLNAGGNPVAITGQTTISGGLAVTDGSMTHNGVDIGSGHEHINVQPGSGNSGPPVS